MLGNISVYYNKFVCPAFGVICQKTVPYANHTKNVAQQSDLFAVINVVREQTISNRFVSCSQSRMLNVISCISKAF